MKYVIYSLIFVGCCGVMNAANKKQHEAQEPVTPRAAQNIKLRQEAQLNEQRLEVLKSGPTTSPEQQLRVLQETSSREGYQAFLNSIQIRIANGQVLI